MTNGAKQLALGILLAVFFATPSHAGSKDPVGKVANVTGAVFGEHGGKKAPLESGSDVFAGEKIVTKTDSTATVLLSGSEAAILVKPDSELRIKQDKSKDWQVELKKGAVTSVVKSQPKRPDYFRVRTKTAVMGVRGTAFFVEAKPNEPVYVCACKGKVSIADLSGKSEYVVTSKHHDAPKVIEPGTGEIKTRLAESVQKDHSDEETEPLVKLVAGE